MSVREFSEWVAYSKLEPFGQDRGDVPIAILGSFFGNMWRGKGSRRLSVSDFLPDFGEHKASRVQTPDEMKMNLSLYCEALKQYRSKGSG